MKKTGTGIGRSVHPIIGILPLNVIETGMMVITIEPGVMKITIDLGGKEVLNCVSFLGPA